MTGHKARKFVCSSCQKTYGKSEHLKRHERTHTGSKPYVCPLCASVFSRQDSLSRHVKRHRNAKITGAAVDPGTYPTSRPNGSQSHLTSHRNRSPGHDTDASVSKPRHGDQEYFSGILGSDRPYANGVDPLNAPDSGLNWPDAEDLLQSILSVEAPIWQFDDAFSLPAFDSELTTSGSTIHTSVESSTASSSTLHNGHEAVQDLSEMITNVWSVDVTADAMSLGLTTTFLDSCLQAFWTRFVPSFPVFHAPTFVFRNWSYPLLLNAIAVGSLFTEQNDDRHKGEVLWKLAYTAVATSWQTLIRRKGLYDSCYGVQLVLAALLGQVYAISSKNEKIRTISRVFHSMGFFWAQESGMYYLDHSLASLSTQAKNETSEEVQRRWQTWAAREVLLRALLGHYILDGQIAQYNGGRLCQRHSANPLPHPCDDDLFAASSHSEWLCAAGQRRQYQTTFRDTITTIFSTHVHIDHLRIAWTAPTIQVTSEAIKSLLYEIQESPHPVIGCPTRSDIAYALSRLYHLIEKSPQTSHPNRTIHIIQWHAIALEACTDTAQLCHNLCHKLHVNQSVFKGKQPDPSFEITQWTRNTTNSRRALLHAIAIRDNLTTLNPPHTQDFHLPIPTFAAALIYTVHRLSGIHSIPTPRVQHWESFVQLPLDESSTPTNQIFDTGENNDLVHRYLHDYEHPPTSSTSDLVVCDLDSDMALFATTLQNLGSIWGVAHELLGILRQLNWDLAL